MKIARFAAADERRILTAMITSDTALRQIASHWRAPGLFTAEWANLIGKWCVTHMQKYETAPSNRIRDYFERWSQNGADRSIVNVVHKFLASLSDEYEQQEQDTQYVIDVAAKHFNRSALLRLSEELQERLENGQDDKANELILGHRAIEFGTHAGIDILQDQEALCDALETKEREVLLNYPTPLGDFFRQQFTRDSLIAFMGPDKRGKSFWLLDAVFRAVTQRRKTAYFIIGDMSQRQVTRRLITRVCKRPLYPTEYKMPVGIKPDGAYCKVKRETISTSDHIQKTEMLERFDKLVRAKIRSHNSYLKLVVHPSMSVTLDDLHTTLKNWEYHEDWLPDVIVIDYADNLASKHTRLDYREQINYTWAQLRQLSQELHGLVITATQSDAAAYRQPLIRRHNFSDSKKKLAHVNGMLGINVIDDEKRKGVTRLNWIELRDADFTETEVVHIAGCLSIANPAVLSCWPAYRGETS